MGFRLQQKLMALNDLERQFAALSTVYVGCNQTAEGRIMRISL